MSKKHYTTFDIARICDVQPATVAYWIEQGQLHAHKTPGGHRRVTPDNLYVFLRSHSMPVPEELQQEERSRILLIKQNANGSSLLPSEDFETPQDVEIKVAENNFNSGMLMVSFKPQCVVVELDASITDPAEYCQQIKSANSNGKMILIAVGDDLSTETINSLQEVGVSDYIEGRVSPHELFQKIQKILL